MNKNIEEIISEKILGEDKKSARAKLITAIQAFYSAADNLTEAWEDAQSEGIEDEEWALKKYPFKLSFDEMAAEIRAWAVQCSNSLKSLKFTN